MVMASIFSKIVAGEIPCYKVAEDDRFLAFLDISPMMEGHTLVIPKQETDYIFDLDTDLYAGLMLFARRVAEAQKRVINCRRVAVAVLGMEVPHAHVHLVPIQKEGDMSFSNPKQSFTPQQMVEIAARIASAFQ